MSVNYKNICREIEDAAKETGKFIREESRVFDINRAESKGLHDLVSYVDKGSEKLLVDRLNKILPEAGFITEEGTSSKKGEKFCWIIDPLDGTTNFIHGVHPYAISVGLREDDEIIAGVVYEAGGSELFSADSWLADMRLRIGDVSCRVRDFAIGKRIVIFNLNIL